MMRKHLSVKQDVNEGSRTMMKRTVKLTKWFNVKVELNEKSTLSSFLCTIIMDRWTSEIKEESP